MLSLITRAADCLHEWASSSSVRRVLWQLSAQKEAACVGEVRSPTNMMLAVMMDPPLRPSLSAMKPMLSIPNMIPAIWEYVSESRRLLLH